MTDAEYIVGLMRTETDALGFIPAAGVERHVASDTYILQTDRSGRPVGYLLQSPLRPGAVALVHQACVDVDRRLRGFGEEAFREFLRRCRLADCRAVRLRCGADMMAANAFWRGVGLRQVSVREGGQRRDRSLNVYWLDLWPVLPLETADHA